MGRVTAFSAAAVIAGIVVATLLFLGGGGEERETGPDAQVAPAADRAEPLADPAAGPAATAPASGWTALVVGDSIGAAYGLGEKKGWVHLAETALREEFPDIGLVNASISGDTTDGGLRRLPAALERFEPELVILELGGNDGLRGNDIERMRQNIENMARLSQEAGARVLILGMMIPSNYGKDYTERFGEAFVAAAESTDSALVPFLLEPIATDRAFFQSDGIHPTAEAQPLLAEHVLPALREIVAAHEAGSS